MNGQIVSMLRDAISTHLHQSETGILQGTPALWAHIVASEFGTQEQLIRTELRQPVPRDIAKLLENDRWVGVAYGLNCEVTFFDKRRHNIPSVTESELEAYKQRALRITARGAYRGQ